MTTLTPFEGEFCGKIYTIYAVNNTEPYNNPFYSSMTSSELCTHCGTHNIFRFYEPKDEYETDESYISIYDCRCPKCGKEFDVRDEFEKEEE